MNTSEGIFVSVSNSTQSRVGYNGGALEDRFHSSRLPGGVILQLAVTARMRENFSLSEVPAKQGQLSWSHANQN